MGMRYIRKCDACGKEYEQPMGVSYDPANFAGTDWTLISIEGRRGEPSLLCNYCSFPIRDTLRIILQGER